MIAEKDLTVHEQRVRDAAGAGAAVDLRPAAGGDDPAQGKAWGSDRAVRAEFLVDLLAGTRKPKTGPLRSVRLLGARITGPLDLAFLTVSCPLIMEGCYFEEPVVLRMAKVSTVSLSQSEVPGVDARGLRADGDLGFSGIRCRGELTLNSARVGGHLELDGASLSNAKGW